MSSPQETPSLSSCRASARRLLKQLRSGEADAVAAALARFRGLRSFATLSAADTAQHERIQLKHALAVVAQEAGYASWTAMKRALEATMPVPAPRRAARRNAAEEIWYGRGMAVFLNRWYPRHEEAKADLERAGGYLLPYRHHFFVCTAEAVRVLGLDPEDADWARIGHDGARPKDAEAFQRLLTKREAVVRAQAMAHPDSGRGG